MMRWKMDELVRQIETKTGENLTIREIVAQTGLAKSTTHEIMTNQKTRLDLKVIDIILTWASHKLKKTLTPNDLCEYERSTWTGPTHPAEWDSGVQNRRQ